MSDENKKPEAIEIILEKKAPFDASNGPRMSPRTGKPMRVYKKGIPPKDIRGKLEPREFLFVQHVSNGSDPISAVKKSGYRTKTPKQQVTQLMKRPEVQNSLAAAIREQCPDIELVLGRKLLSVMDLPIKLRKDQEGITITELKQIGELFKDTFGWSAPKRTEALKADVTKLLLPKK